jgi:hypothetical protein
MYTQESNAVLQMLKTNLKGLLLVSLSHACDIKIELLIRIQKSYVMKYMQCNALQGTHAHARARAHTRAYKLVKLHTSQNCFRSEGDTAAV